MISTKHPETTGSARWWHFWQCERCDSPAAETRHNLLEAAFDEIHRTGFQAASLHRILRRTGLTKGALYHHFPNKLALGYAVVDELLGPYLEQNWLAPLRSGFAGPEGPAAASNVAAWPAAGAVAASPGEVETDAA